MPNEDNAPANGDIPSAPGGEPQNDHLDQVLLRMGDRALPLVKSTRLIGVRTAPGVRPAVVGEMLPESGQKDAPHARLGGFELVNMEDRGIEAEETLDAVRLSPLVDAGTHVYYTSDDGVPFVPTGELYIECYANVPLEECSALLDEYSLQLVKAYGPRAFVARVTADSPNPIKVAARLQESPLIRTAEPDLATPDALQAFVVPDDPLAREQWHLRNTGNNWGTPLFFRAGADARVFSAWEAAESLGSTDCIVAVIDDGFDLNHPDLLANGKFVAPRDFTRGGILPLPDPASRDWHGTACAGVALANGNHEGVLGAAPACRLMPIRWGLNLSDSQVEAWFDHARENGAWVVSCSWRAQARYAPLSSRQKAAIARCARESRGGKGAVICFAAGNETSDIDNPAVPTLNGYAVHEDVLAIAASTSRDARSNYSNFGDRIAVCAPSSGAGGAGIVTTDVTGTYLVNGQQVEAGYSTGPYTRQFGGTSSSTPLVAGICALVLSANEDLMASEVRDIIRRTARRIGNPALYDANGHSRLFGHGCVDAEAAVRAALEGPAAGPQILPEWGHTGHGFINTIAVSAVPEPLNRFYEQNITYFGAHAMDPDNARNTDPDEAPRHFINIDKYGPYPFSALPEDYAAAVTRYTEPVVIERGIVPWTIEKRFLQLVEAFRAVNRDDIKRHSAWLGHYVGDCHVPLHVTANFNGQLTGQRGLHSYFEERVVQETISRADIQPPVAQEITAIPHAVAFEWVRESYTYVQAIVDADAANGGRRGRRNFRAFSTLVRPIAIDRLTKGSSRLASLWYTAWIQGGRPDL